MLVYTVSHPKTTRVLLDKILSFSYSTVFSNRLLAHIRCQYLNLTENEVLNMLFSPLGRSK